MFFKVKPKITMWQVYIVKCSDGKLYTGITKCLKRRLAQHNSGNGGRFTKFRSPVKLVYHRRVLNRSFALINEARIKKLSREEKLALVKSLRRTGKK